jgi:hypothetical protein
MLRGGDIITVTVSNPPIANVFGDKPLSIVDVISAPI